MAGVEILEQVDVGRSLRSGRLVVSLDWGGDYDAAALMFLGAAMLGPFGWVSYRTGRIGIVLAVLAIALSLAGLRLAWKLGKASVRNRDLVQIPGASDAEGTRAAFTRAADNLGWEKNRNNSDFARYFFDRYVVTVLFRRDHVLFNCRRTNVNHMRLPMGAKERDEILRAVSDAMKVATAPSNPALNPTGLRPAG
jgi:hypothetical protein